MTQDEIQIWHGCYDDGWKATPRLIVDAAFAHPAKFARGLIERIVTHGLECGYWKAGDIIGDPFAGVALGGIIAGYHGLSWLGVELEEKFVKLGRQNLDLHREKIKALGYNVTLELHQGDSRQFAALVDGICTSPPFAESLGSKEKGGGCLDPAQAERYSGTGMGKWKHGQSDYGSTPGQIGRLPAGSVDGICTSPPFVSSISGGDGVADKNDWFRDRNTPGGQVGRSSNSDYGTTPGQIGNLKQGSLDGICTIPPWERVQATASGDLEARAGRTDIEGSYGESLGQIGNSSGETYWQAMAQVYGQCLQCLKPGGVMAVVVKDYVKNGKRVPLCDDTLRLLVSLGFQPVERIHAMLVREWTEPHLFKGQVKKRKERKSFFRRLAENRGSPRIDYECVLFVRAAV